MNEFNEVTAENLRFVRGAKGMNQAEIAELLGITQTAVSKIEKGQRALSDSEKALLDLYFFGKMPFEIVNQVLLKSVLEFTPLQWRVITIIATKRGMKPGAWIADRIRDFLVFNEHARAVAAEQAENEPIHLHVAADGRMESAPMPTQKTGTSERSEGN